MHGRPEPLFPLFGAARAMATDILEGPRPRESSSADHSPKRTAIPQAQMHLHGHASSSSLVGRQAEYFAALSTGLSEGQANKLASVGASFFEQTSGGGAADVLQRHGSPERRKIKVSQPRRRPPVGSATWFHSPLSQAQLPSLNSNIV